MAIGTGFSHATLEQLHGKLRTANAIVTVCRARKDEAVTTWVKPRLVAEVKFTKWTSAARLSVKPPMDALGDNL